MRMSHVYRLLPVCHVYTRIYEQLSASACLLPDFWNSFVQTSVYGTQQCFSTFLVWNVSYKTSLILRTPPNYFNTHAVLQKHIWTMKVVIKSSLLHNYTINNYPKSKGNKPMIRKRLNEKHMSYRTEILQRAKPLRHKSRLRNCYSWYIHQSDNERSGIPTHNNQETHWRKDHGQWKHFTKSHKFLSTLA